MHALVTGSSGFIGQHLVAALKAQQWHVSTVSRAALASQADSYTNFAAVPLATVDVVYHLAGVAHEGVAGVGASELSATNADATLVAFQQSMQAGVSRFVWLSSFKVMGDCAPTPLGVEAKPAPQDSYACSKAAGERLLINELSQQNWDPERLAIVRPPLVYGPGVKANFLQMLRWSQSSWPLPLAAAQHGRAWLSVANLTSFLMLLAHAQLHKRVLWHVCDDEQISVREMLDLMAKSSDRKSRLWTLPIPALRLLAACLGKSAQATRLLNPLMMDATPCHDVLGWQPVVSQSSAISEVVQWYLSQS